MKKNTNELKKQAEQLGYELFYNKTTQNWTIRTHGTTNEKEIGNFESAQEFLGREMDKREEI